MPLIGQPDRTGLAPHRALHEPLDDDGQPARRDRRPGRGALERDRSRIHRVRDRPGGHRRPPAADGGPPGREPIQPARDRALVHRHRRPALGRHRLDTLGVTAFGHEAGRQLMVDPAAPGALQAGITKTCRARASAARAHRLPMTPKAASHTGHGLTVALRTPAARWTAPRSMRTNASSRARWAPCPWCWTGSRSGRPTRKRRALRRLRRAFRRQVVADAAYSTRPFLTAIRVGGWEAVVRIENSRLSIWHDALGLLATPRSSGVRAGPRP